MSQQTPHNRVLFHRTLTSVVSGLFVVAAILGGVFVSSPHKASAAVTNGTLNFQARLEGQGGNIAADGFYNVQFKIYNVDNAGTALWTESYYDTNGVTAGNDNRIKVVNGYLSANLGSINTSLMSGSGINWDQDNYITLNIGGTAQTASPSYDGEMNPRLKLTGVPYAFRAGQLAQFNETTGYTSTLSLLQPTVGNQSFQIQDQGAAGTYSLCVQSATNAAGGCAASTGAAGYIQNQSALQQASTSFWISGIGRSDTALQAPAFDTPTAVALNIGTTNATSITLGKTGVNTIVGGNLSVGTTQSFGAITIANGAWFTSLDSAGTGSVNMFSVNASNQIQVGAALSIDGGIILPTNGGQLTLADLPIDTTATNGTKQSYTLRVGSSNALTVYGEADGAGNAQNIRVGIGSSITPGYTLDVGGDINVSSGSVYRINGTQICSVTGCTAAAGSTNYIQNQSALQQTTSTYWISGTGRADTALQAPIFDTATGVALNIGSTNATQINLNQNVTMAGAKSLTFGAGLSNFDQSASSGTFATSSGTNTLNGNTSVAAGKTFTANGTAVFKNNANSTTAFQIQNAATAAFFTADSTNQIITTKDLNVGSAITIGGAGRLFSDGFESGNLNLWSLGTSLGSGSTIGADATISRNGKYSLKVVATAAVSAVNTKIASSPTVAARGYFYATAQPSVSNAEMFAVANRFDPTGYISVNRSSGGILCVYRNYVDANTCSATAMPLSQWNKIELVVTSSTTTSGSYTLYLNGISILTASGIQTNTSFSNLDEAIIGTNIISVAAQTYWVDDFSVDTVLNGDSSSLNVADSLHVSGSSSFGANALFQSRSDNATAFQIQNAAGTSNLLVADTATSRIGIGGAGTDSKLTIIDNGTIAANNTATDRNSLLRLQADDNNPYGLVFGNSAYHASNGYAMYMSSVGTLNFTDPQGSDVMALSAAGAAYFRNRTDSTNGFLVQNAAGADVFSANTTTGKVTINQGGLTVSGIPNPATPTLATLASTGSLTAQTYVYRLAATGPAGETQAILTNPTSVTTTGSASRNTISWSAVTNATGYKLYRSTNAGTSWSVVVLGAVTSYADTTNASWGASSSPYLYGNDTGDIQLTDGANINFDAAKNAAIRYDAPANTFVLGNYAAGGNILLQSQNFYFSNGDSSATYFAINNNGSATFKNSVNNATAFQIQNSVGVSLFNVDTDETSSGLIVIGPTNNNGSARILFGDRGSANNVWVGESGTADTDVLQLQGMNGLNFSIGTGATNVAMIAATTGAATFQNAADSTTAFAIKNSNSISQLTVDTTLASPKIYIGPTAGDTVGTVLVLGKKTSFTSGSQVSDPTGVAGAMYYNSATGAFRCYAVDYWMDCLVSARTSFHRVYEMGIGAANGEINASNLATTGSLAYDNATAGRPTIVLLKTGASATGFQGVGAIADNAILLGNNDYWRHESAVRIPSATSALSTSAQRYTVRAGFQENTTGDGLDGCFFKYSDNVNSGKWQGLCEGSNPSISLCDTGTTVAVNTWYRLTVVVNAAGTSADFRINGVSTCTITTNIPTVSTKPTSFGVSMEKTIGTTNREIQLDYQEIQGQFGTAR
jgi:hypothetical protein